MKPHSGRKAVSRSTRARMRAAASNRRRLLRCAACMILAGEVPEGFACAMSRCPRKFQRVTVRNGTVIIE